MCFHFEINRKFLEGKYYYTRLYPIEVMRVNIKLEGFYPLEISIQAMGMIFCLKKYIYSIYKIYSNNIIHCFFLVFRLLRSICGVKRAKDMFAKDCEGFSVYPKDYFYPVAWWDWKLYFNEDTADKVSNMTKNSYAIHVWNKHSTNTKLSITSKASYLDFARKYCPKVVAECQEVF